MAGEVVYAAVRLAALIPWKVILTGSSVMRRLENKFESREDVKEIRMNCRRNAVTESNEKLVLCKKAIRVAGAASIDEFYTIQRSAKAGRVLP